MRFIFSILIAAALIGCAHQAMQADRHVSHCNALLVDAEITQCYNAATSSLIARRISAGTLGFSDGDWPHDFQMLVQLQVESTGRFYVESVLRSSDSYLLDKKIMQALNDIDEIFVPSGDLFQSAKYAHLKLLIKPARTPLLGDEQLIDNDALIVYVSKIFR